MKKPSKKLVLIIIALVVVVFGTIFVIKKFFPEPKLDMGMTTIAEIKENNNKKELSTYIDLIITNIENKIGGEDISGNENALEIQKNKNNIYNYKSLILFMDNANQEMQPGLMFGERTQNYNENAKAIQNSLKTLNENLEITHAYIETVAYPFCQTSWSWADMRVYIKEIEGKYKAICENYLSITKNIQKIYEESVALSLTTNLADKKDQEISVAWFEKIFSSCQNGVKIYYIDINNFIKLNQKTKSVQQVSTYIEESKLYDYNVVIDHILKNDLNTFKTVADDDFEQFKNYLKNIMGFTRSF